MSSEKLKVEIFFDVVSPYSWVGFEMLCRYRHKWHLDIVFCPVYLGGIMGATGNKPPALVPAKGKYMFKDIQRLAKLYGLPLKQPEDFQSVMFGGTLTAMRVLTAVSLDYPDKTEEVARQLWLRIWARSQSVKDLASIGEAMKAAGMSEAQIESAIKRGSEDTVKAALKSNTDKAVSAGAFGAPFFVFHTPHGPEEFFGSDRFEVMASVLGLKYEGPLTPGPAPARSTL
jgi:glutathione S-transferase kappa 1